MIKPWVLIAGLALVSPASAQLLGGGGVGGTVGPLVGGVTGPLLDLPRGTSSVAARAIGDLGGPLMAVDGAIRDLSPADLLSLRRARLRALVRDHRAELDVDDDGNPIRRDTILAIGLAPGAVAAIRAAGFTITEADGASTLDIGVVTLTPPSGRSPRKALDTLRTLDPAATFSFDHIYEPAHAPLAPLPGVAPAAGSTEAGTRAPIGLIDGGVGQHAAFAGVMIEQRGFAGTPRPSGHGTAVASLLVGRVGAFHGAAPGTPLLVADVYGGNASNGSAAAILRAMGWLAQRGVRVINISLVGPPNAVLAAGVHALAARGIRLVAAVGNDGPAAPPAYPASYPGVIAVTGVDARGRALIEAGKPLHLDFAAPGADMIGALPGGGWGRVRGTSFAAPLVSARLALAGTVDALAAEARPGHGRVGRGVVCGSCAIAPRAVGLR